VATFHIHVTDEQGHPLNGIYLINGEYNTTPCPYGAWGCTSGPGNSIAQTTDQNGDMSFNIPYTCQASWSGTFRGTGWEDFVWSEQTGSITGDIYKNIVMVADESANGSQPPANKGGNKNAGSILDQLGLTAESGGQGAATGLENPLLLVGLVAFAVVVVVVLVIVYRRA
jgi:hypothetical protein